VVGLVAALVLIPESRAAKRPGLDPVGAAASAVGLVALIYGLIQAGQDGWGDPAVLVPMAVGLAVLGGFAAWERRLGQRGGEPLMDPALFRSASFAWGALLGGIAGLAMIGVLFVMPQYAQAIAGASALGAGFRLLPLIGGLIVGALPAAALARRAGPRLTVTAGFLLLAAGALAGATTGTATATAFIAGWMAVLGAGTGLTLTAATAAALSRLPAERSGTGSAVVQAFQHTAGPLGTAVMGSIVVGGYQARLDLRGIPAAAASAARQSVYNGLAVASRLGSVTLARTARGAFAGGMDTALLASAAIAVVGALLTLAFLPGREDHSERHKRQSRPAGTAGTQEGQDPGHDPGLRPAPVP